MPTKKAEDKHCTLIGMAALVLAIGIAVMAVEIGAGFVIWANNKSEVCDVS